MTDVIEKYISENNTEQALEECLRSNKFFLGLFIGRLSPLATEKYYELMAGMEKGTKNLQGETVLPFLEVKKENISASLPVQEHVVDKVATCIEEKATLELIENSIVEVETRLETKKENIVSKIRVKLLCNWCSSEELVKLWNKLSKGNYTWNSIQAVWEDPADFWVIVNAPPPGTVFDPKKTIIFRMEPHMSRHPGIWKEWSDPRDVDFLKVLRHEKGDYNNNEWHLSKTFTELKNMQPEKDPKLDLVLSTVLSEKYTDPGHVKRVDFVKFLERKGLPVHVYGSNKWEYKDYKGSLPVHCKDNAIFPYKYTFNVENHYVKNYYTEKLVDGILGECLVFYSGCFNVKEYIDERAYVYLDLSNFQKDYETIKKAMEENWHAQRLPFIRAAKQKILEEQQFFPRLEKIIALALR